MISKDNKIMYCLWQDFCPLWRTHKLRHETSASSLLSKPGEKCIKRISCVSFLFFINFANDYQKAPAEFWALRPDFWPTLRLNFPSLVRRCSLHHLFVVLFLRRCLFILKSFYDILCILCEPGQNMYQDLLTGAQYVSLGVNLSKICIMYHCNGWSTLQENFKYLELVSESKKTLENSARMIRTDANAGKRPTWNWLKIKSVFSP